MTHAIPQTSAELEEFMSSDESMNSLFSREGKPLPAFKDFLKAYADISRKTDPTIGEQVKAEVQRVNNEWLRENSAKIGRPQLTTGTNAVPKGYNKRACGAKIDKYFTDTGDFFKAIHHTNDKPENLSLLREVRDAYGTGVPADGGFLVPEILRAQLLSVALEGAVVRPRAMVIPMDQQRVPFPIIDSTSNASSVMGGLTGYWTEESGQLTASQAKFGRVALDAKKLTIYGEAPNELFQDSIISFQAFIDQKLPEAITWFEDIGFISGSGVGEPLGWLNAAAAVSVSKETGQAATTIVWENIVKAFARMLPSSLGRAVWVCNIDCFPELATMALAVGTGGSAIWIGNGQGVGAPPVTILGRPVIFTEKVSTVGTVGDINFVDLGYYLVGDRMAMQSATSPHYKFQNDQTVFRVIQRVDGRPWMQSAITPQTGANTLSPFVKVATR